VGGIMSRYVKLEMSCRTSKTSSRFLMLDETF